MGLALEILKIYAPPAFQKRILRELYRATAGAFDKTPPDLGGLSHAALLESYADFTRIETERVLQDPDLAARVEERLYASSRALGERLRRALKLRTPRQVLAISKILYSALGIGFEGRDTGEVTICRCYFSGFYSADTCRVMSSADAGVAAGLSGGGRLAFSQRITEGGDACRARLVFEEPGR